MTIQEVLFNNIVTFKRVKTLHYKGQFFAIYDIEVCSFPIKNSVFYIKRKIFLRLNKRKKDFEIIDPEYYRNYVDFTYTVCNYVFKIRKEKIFKKLKEKYGDSFMVKIYGEENITTDLFEYIDKDLFTKNKLLIFNNRLYHYYTDKMIKYDDEISRFYKIKTLKNKIEEL